MQYICPRYIRPSRSENMPESERNAIQDEHFAYDNQLRKTARMEGRYVIPS